MDNLRVHCSERCLRILAEVSVFVLTYPPHSSGIFQLLDLVTNELIKRQMKEDNRFSDIYSNADHSIRLLSAYQQSSKWGILNGYFFNPPWESERKHSKVSFIFSEFYFSTKGFKSD